MRTALLASEATRRWMETTMHVVRVIAVLTLAIVGSRSTAAAQSPPPGPPTASELEAGDLVWPKRPGALVPYTSQPGSARESDAEKWEEEKQAYLDSLQRQERLADEERERYTALRSMTYKAFLALYLDDARPDRPTNYSSSSVYVGHVGIVALANGLPHVVEAVMGKGVRRVPYEQWLAERTGELVWLGRVKDEPRDRRAAIANTAELYVGRPYSFWNFDLKDDRAFYCSKLAWLAIVTATGVSPDDDLDPKRRLWFSPKKLLRSPHIQVIRNPGSYGGR